MKYNLSLMEACSEDRKTIEIRRIYTSFIHPPTAGGYYHVIGGAKGLQRPNVAGLHVQARERIQLR